MNRDKDRGGGEQKKNPDKLKNGEQKKNPDMGDEGGEQKKNSDKDGGGGEHKKNPDKEDDGGEQKKPMKGSQLQPKEDKEQKQQPEETKPADVGTQEEILSSVLCMLCSQLCMLCSQLWVHVQEILPWTSLVVYLRDKLNRPVEAVVPVKKDDKNGKGDSEKKLEDEAAALEDLHKDKGKGIEVAAAGGFTLGSQETTVLLRIRIHCDACADRIRRRIYRVKGVEDVFLDMTKDEVKVGGTMDVAAMVVYLRDKLNRPVEAVVPAKKDDKNGKGDSEKKLEDEAAAPEDVQKDKGKGIEVAAAGGGEQAPAPVEASSSPAYVQPQGPPPSYYNNYGCNADGVGYQPYQLYPPHFFNVAPPPQMFSDENPNACSVM